MARILLCGIASCLLSSSALGQRSDVPELTQEQADSRTVIGVANEYLAAGAEAIRARQYDDGIRLTKLGLDRPTSPRDRAAALSNLCAAHAAKNEPDTAIGYCTESLGINDANWRAYSNRAYAYYLKREFDQADSDLDVALSINPNAQTDAADSRHDERAAAARPRHDGGTPIARWATHCGSRGRGRVSRDREPSCERRTRRRSIPSARGAASSGGIPSSVTSACYSTSARSGLARLARVENEAVPAWTGSTPWILEDRADAFRRSADRTAIHGRPAPRQSRRQLANADGDRRLVVRRLRRRGRSRDERAARSRAASGAAARDGDAALSDRGDPRSEAGACRHVFSRRRDGRHRRAGDHRAIGRSVSRADTRGAESFAL